jgi:enamine deaminase RidA (YjgF/YER057c/UK114 family)
VLGLDVEDDCEPRRDVADVMQEFERRERPVASCVGKVQARTASAKPPCVLSAEPLAAGDIVGDDLATQATQALTNVEAALTAAGATIHDVVRWTIAVVDGQPLQEGFRAFAPRWGAAADPPAISVYVVAGLAHPRFLIEIDAIAVV